MKVTRKLPCRPVHSGDAPDMFDFTGHDFGPMFVHKSTPDYAAERVRGRWTVTHIKTGHSVKVDIRSRDRAIRMARELGKLPCWDFSDVAACKKHTKKYMKIIKPIMEAS